MQEYGTPYKLGVKSGEFLECIEWAGGYYTVGQIYPVVDGHGYRQKTIGTKDVVGVWKRAYTGSLEDQVKELLG